MSLKSKSAWQVLSETRAPKQVSRSLRLSVLGMIAAAKPKHAKHSSAVLAQPLLILGMGLFRLMQAAGHTDDKLRPKLPCSQYQPGQHMPSTAPLRQPEPVLIHGKGAIRHSGVLQRSAGGFAKAARLPLHCMKLPSPQHLQLVARPFVFAANPLKVC